MKGYHKYARAGLVFGLFLVAPLVIAQVSVPNTFQAGEKAVASEVNANFSALVTEINALDGDIDALATTVSGLEAGNFTAVTASQDVTAGGNLQTGNDVLLDGAIQWNDGGSLTYGESAESGFEFSSNVTVDGFMRTEGSLSTGGSISSGGSIFANNRIFITDSSSSESISRSRGIISYNVGANSGDDHFLFNKNVTIGGALEVLGVKNFVYPHPEDPSKQIKYISSESGKAMVTWSGRAKLENGRAEVPLPEHFRHVATDKGEIEAHLTPIGEWAPLYVEEVSRDRLVIAAADGAPNVEFSVSVEAERAGFENHEAVVENSRFRPHAGESLEAFGERLEHYPSGVTAALVQNGTLNADGTVNASVAERLGWTSQRKELAQAR